MLSGILMWHPLSPSYYFCPAMLPLKKKENLRLLHVFPVTKALQLTECRICHPLPNTADRNVIAVPLNTSGGRFPFTGFFWYPFPSQHSAPPPFYLVKLRSWPHINKMLVLEVFRIISQRSSQLGVDTHLKDSLITEIGFLSLTSAGAV